MFDGALRDVSDIKTICAVGTGAMGAGTALSFAMAGYDVRLYGRTDKSIAAGTAGINDALKFYQEHGVVEAKNVPVILSRIHMTTSLAQAAKGADFAIESIEEKTSSKQELFAQLEKLCPPHAIFATNTSALSPTEIAEAIDRKDRFVVTHFWNPPHLIPLVEVVPGALTSSVTVNIAYDLMQKIGKMPVRLEKEAPGFVGNRLQIALLREALHIYQSGLASREKIDAAVTNGFGRELATTGLFEGARNDGFDKLHHDYEKLEVGLCNDAGIPTILQRLVARDKLGSKKGEGIYVWPAAELAEIKEKRGSELIRHLIADIEERNRDVGQTATAYDDTLPARPVTTQKDWLASCAIESRLRHALMREAFYIVDSGIASAKDVDIVIKHSIGRRLPITGPLTSADLGGLDIFESIFKTLGPHLCNDAKIPYLSAHTAKIATHAIGESPFAELAAD